MRVAASGNDLRSVPRHVRGAALLHAAGEPRLAGDQEPHRRSRPSADVAARRHASGRRPAGDRPDRRQGKEEQEVRHVELRQLGESSSQAGSVQAASHHEHVFLLPTADWRFCRHILRCKYPILY